MKVYLGVRVTLQMSRQDTYAEGSRGYVRRGKCFGKIIDQSAVGRDGECGVQGAILNQMLVVVVGLLRP